MLQRRNAAKTLLVCWLATRSAGAMQPARSTPDQPESAAERVARERVRNQACPVGVGLLFPGVGQFCLGRTAEGAALTALGVAELGTAAASIAAVDEGRHSFEHPAVTLPLIAFQYAWAYSFVDSVFERQRAKRLSYVPLDTPAELALAPFNPRVLGHADVWLAILASFALGFGASALIDEGFSSEHFGEDPKLFGRTFRPGVGYPLAAAVGAGVFSHVAVAEESLFRGMIQSQMAREMDPTRAWVGSSLFFGFAHAANVIGVSQDDQLAYLAVGVPVITALGSYLGFSYQRHGYSLAPPVAIHFWYDFLISAASYISDPQHSDISARVSVPF